MMAMLALDAAGAIQPRSSQTDGSWWSIHGDHGNTRFSALQQINRANVNRLGAAWTFKFPQGASSRVTPVVHGGLMFVSAGVRIYALDAANGGVVWTFDTDKGDAPNPADIIHYTESALSLTGNQGLAVGGGAVFAGLTDGQLLALDETTGKVRWRLSLADKPAKKVQTVAAPPVYADGVIYAALSTVDRFRGRVVALDARSGVELWHFSTIPGPGEPGHETWPSDSEIWKWGGGNVWLPPTVDTQLGLIIFGTGNAFPYQGGELRPGDNLYTNSVVALDLKSGNLRWYFQTTHHDLWDTDIPTPVILYDAGRGSPARKAVAAMRPDGILFMLDRATGKSLFPIEERPVPQNDLDRTSATQPYPVGVNGILPECESYRGLVPTGFRLGCTFVPPTPDQPVLSPGIGVRVRPMSYSPDSGYFYAVGSAGLAWPRRTLDPWVGTFAAASHVPGIQKSYSTVTAALDSRTGKLVWRVELPGSGGGLLSTAGGLVFQRAGNGEFRAYDSRNGEIRWRFLTGQGAGSMSPISYRVHGEQFVSIVEGPEVWAFKLGGTISQRPPINVAAAQDSAAAESNFVGPVEDTQIITATSLVQEDIYQSGPHFGIDEYSFNPYRARVQVGQRVTFANNGHVTHSMTSVDGTWSTGPLLPDDAVDLVFDKEGVYTYISQESPFQYGQLIVARAKPADSPSAEQPLDVQARRGKSLYARNCANCHGSELNGRDSFPALTGEEFGRKWRKKTAQDLYERIENTMPQGQPRSLAAGTYNDILAYLIKANDWPASDDGLRESQRKDIVLDK